MKSNNGNFLILLKNNGVYVESKKKMIQNEFIYKTEIVHRHGKKNYGYQIMYTSIKTLK